MLPSTFIQAMSKSAVHCCTRAWCGLRSSRIAQPCLAQRRSASTDSRHMPSDPAWRSACELVDSFNAVDRSQRLDKVRERVLYVLVGDMPVRDKLSTVVLYCRC